MMEPEANAFLSSDLHPQHEEKTKAASIYSIAISLKRIADVMEGTAEASGVAFILAEIMENLRKIK